MCVRYMLFPPLLLAHAPSTAHSQQLVTGDTIRVRPLQSTEPGRQWTDATVARLAPDTLWYRSRDTLSPMLLDNADIQLPTFRDHRWAGARLGGLAGGAVGALVSYLGFEPEIGPAECGYAITLGLCRAPRQINSGLIASTKGAAAGALIGGMVGWFVGRTAGRWESVEVDQITARDGALSLSFRIRP